MAESDYFQCSLMYRDVALFGLVWLISPREFKKQLIFWLEEMACLENSASQEWGDKRRCVPLASRRSTYKNTSSAYVETRVCSTRVCIDGSAPAGRAQRRADCSLRQEARTWCPPAGCSEDLLKHTLKLHKARSLNENVSDRCHFILLLQYIYLRSKHFRWLTENTECRIK